MLTATTPTLEYASSELVCCIGKDCPLHRRLVAIAMRRTMDVILEGGRGQYTLAMRVASV